MSPHLKIFSEEIRMVTSRKQAIAMFFTQASLRGLLSVCVVIAYVIFGNLAQVSLWRPD